MEKENWKVLNRDTIKYIAMAAMLLNHVANVFLQRGTLLYEVFVDIGYFTAITMCYFLVEGYRYTRSKKKYGIRLLVFALISQPAFAFAFPHNNGRNMMFTLLVCFLILVVRERMMPGIFRMVVVMLLVFLSVSSDWAIFAPVFTILFDEWRGDRERIRAAYIGSAVAFGVLNLINYLDWYGAPKALLCTAGAMSGILVSGFVIQYLYNGKRAEHGRTVSKWFFYVFYPAHLVILGAIRLGMQAT